MFVSETYDLWDTLKYDNATLTNHNDSFWVSATDITRNDEDSSITISSGSVNIFSDISGDISIELDLKSDMPTSQNIFYIRRSSVTLSSYTLLALGMTENAWKHLKINIKNNLLSIEGTSITNVDVTGYNQFSVRARVGNITYFKNCKIYSV